jgi:NAD(P)H-nitrite reductase large subunit
MKYVIIGAGVAGVTAAKTLRQQDAAAEIKVFTNEFHPLGLYARKDLARSLANALPEADTFLLDSADELKAQKIPLDYESVERVFADRQQILKNHALRERYDRLLLATGATPRLVDVSGLHYIGVHQVRNYDDALLVETWIPYLHERGAVIVGGGVLALDMAWALRQRGIAVTMVVREAHVGAPLLSAQAAELVHAHLQRDGVQVLCNQTIAGYISEDERVLDGVQLADGNVLPARMALNAVGVYANSELLEGVADIDDDSGALLVNSTLQTSREHIYAAGSCARVGGQQARNWRDSAEQGRVAALNLLGIETAYDTHLMGDLDSRIYDLPLAYFGMVDAADTAGEHEHETKHEATDAGFSTVTLQAGRVVGAVLVGDAAANAQALYDGLI